MENPEELLAKIFDEDVAEEKYLKLGLKFNPFPKSGTADISGTDLYNGNLLPVDEEILNGVLDFLRAALNPNPQNSEDRFISATIIGDYGSGKTQLLMFVKCLLSNISTSHKGRKKPYVVYIDRPGGKLLDLIGSIISKIGEENFKKFLWTKLIDKIKASREYKQKLEPFKASSDMLFNGVNSDPYSDENAASYKLFLSAFTSFINHSNKRRNFDYVFREILLDILNGETQDPVIAKYFYEIISADFGVNKTWEELSAGNIKQLSGKEAKVIKYIFQIVKEQGYTDILVLVDEFEDIAIGRLTKSQADNYVYNLRSLVDEYRNWCLLFAMTGQALERLRMVSPPMTDRMTARLINIQTLDNKQAQRLAVNYLKMCQNDPDSLTPFTAEGVDRLNELVEGNARRFLQNCYFLIEHAGSELEEGENIDAKFIDKHFVKS